MIETCHVCDSDKPLAIQGSSYAARTCPDCNAKYHWNEGYMLSSRWAADTIRQLRARIKELER